MTADPAIEPLAAPADLQNSAGRRTAFALAAIFALPAAAFLANSYQLIAFPHVWENGEAFVLADAQALARGESPYRGLRDYPLLVCNYPPVYHALCAVGVWLAGPSSFAPGRAITFLGFLLISLATAGIVSRETSCKPLACAAGLMIYSVDCIGLLGPTCRVDVLAAAFSIAGVWLVHRQAGTRGWVAPVVFFLLAGYTKQSAVAGAAAAIVYLFITDRRKAVKSLALLAGCGLAILLALQLATGGLFLKNILGFTWTRMDWMHVWRYVRGLLRRGGAVFVLGSCLAIATTILRRRWRSPRRLLLLYLAFNTLLLVQLGKAGVSYLYLVEFAAAACVLTALAIDDVIRTPSTLRARVAASAAILLVALAHVAYQWPALRGAIDPPVSASAERWERYLASMDGPILAEDPGYLISAGKPVVANPFILTQLGAPTRFAWVARGSGRRRAAVANPTIPQVRAAYGRVLDDIRNGRFAAIQTATLVDFRMYGPLPPRFWSSRRMLTDERFGPEWQDAIRTHYRLERQVGIGGIYVPQ